MFYWIGYGIYKGAKEVKSPGYEVIWGGGGGNGASHEAANSGGKSKPDVKQLQVAIFLLVLFLQQLVCDAEEGSVHAHRPQG